MALNDHAYLHAVVILCLSSCFLVGLWKHRVSLFKRVVALGLPCASQGKHFEFLDTSYLHLWQLVFERGCLIWKLLSLLGWHCVELGTEQLLMRVDIDGRWYFGFWEALSIDFWQLVVCNCSRFMLAIRHSCVLVRLLGHFGLMYGIIGADIWGLVKGLVVALGMIRTFAFFLVSVLFAF